MKRIISLVIALAITAVGMSAPVYAKTAASNDKDRYASSSSAKQSWPEAYDSFYSAYEEGVEVVLEPGEDYRPRGEFVYPVYATRSWVNGNNEKAIKDNILAAAETIKSPASFEKTLKRQVVPRLLLETEEGKFYGEGNLSQRKDGKAGISGARQFPVGEYLGRTSLTMTEGIENALLDKKFSPKTTTARAVLIRGYASGIYFRDKNLAAFWCSESLTAHGLTAGKTYTLAQVAKSITENAGKIAEETLLTELKQNPDTAKPVIYLYPEKTTEVSVKLSYPEDFSYTYPAYNNGWQVTAEPGGRLTNKADGSEHWYLFWEGNAQVDWRFDEGFVVKGADTERFLRGALTKLGLTPREQNDFITYWSPEMSRNAQNMITFSTEQYEQLAPLTVSPAPDTVLRVHMVYKPCESGAAIPPQTLAPTERVGFTVVEWGGTRA